MIQGQSIGKAWNGTLQTMAIHTHSMNTTINNPHFSLIIQSHHLVHLGRGYPPYKLHYWLNFRKNEKNWNFQHLIFMICIFCDRKQQIFWENFVVFSWIWKRIMFDSFFCLWRICLQISQRPIFAIVASTKRDGQSHFNSLTPIDGN